MPHLKWPSGQAFRPCNPQGRQGRFLTSIIVVFEDNGPKPNSGIVEQKKAVTAASTLDAKCKGALSFT